MLPDFLEVYFYLVVWPISNSVCYHGLHTELLLDDFVEFV